MSRYKGSGEHTVFGLETLVEILNEENIKLKAQLERAESALKFYSEETSYKRLFDDELGHVLLNEFLTQDWALIVKDCGTRAREYFKEKE